MSLINWNELLQQYSIDSAFSAKALQEANKFSDLIDPVDFTDRKDLTNLSFVTIDGDDSKDFDDAVFARKVGKGYQLLVAIADVAFYVGKKSALDVSAKQRGTSIYLPNAVVPMLPERLSNQLCSLNEGVNRLALVCEMRISNLGEILDYQFYRAVICSKKRLTYKITEEILFKNNQLIIKQYKKLIPSLTNLKEIFLALKQQKIKRGGLEFDFVQPNFVFDNLGNLTAINAEPRLNSHQLIEEVMIAANICAAKLVQKYNLPALFRVHNKPNLDKLAKLVKYLSKLGIKWSGNYLKAEPYNFAQVINKIANRKDKILIEKMILKTMDQAIYSPENNGHFGLNLSDYSHFTSPIRRYPDLLLHRIIINHLQAKKTFVYSDKTLQELGVWCSQTERQAEEISRKSCDIAKCQFVFNHKKDYFSGRLSGVISAVTGFGIFVTLDDFFVDGLVHISQLDSDYYLFYEEDNCLIGRRSGKKYELGQKVFVELARVDIELGRIDFVISNQLKKKSVKSK